MDQRSAEEALVELAPLVGEWTLEANAPSGERWPGQGRCIFEWHDSGAHLVQRAILTPPDAPDSISIIGCDAANGTYVQLYSDERGVCRVVASQAWCKNCRDIGSFRASSYAAGVTIPGISAAPITSFFE